MDNVAIISAKPHQNGPVDPPQKPQHIGVDPAHLGPVLDELERDTKSLRVGHQAQDGGGNAAPIQAAHAALIARLQERQ